MAAVRVKPKIEMESLLRMEVNAKVEVEKKNLDGEFHLIIRREVDSTYNPLKNGDIEFNVVHQEIASVVPALGKEEDDWIIKIHRTQEEKSRFDGDNVVEKVSHRRVFLERNMENPLMKDIVARAQLIKQAEADEKGSVTTASSGDYYEISDDTDFETKRKNHIEETSNERREMNEYVTLIHRPKLEMPIVYPANDAIVVSKEKLRRDETWTKMRSLEDGEFIREKQEGSEDVQLTSDERFERRHKRTIEAKVAQKAAEDIKIIVADEIKDSKAVPREDDIKIVMAEEVREPGYEVMKADEIMEPAFADEESSEDYYEISDNTDIETKRKNHIEETSNKRREMNEYVTLIHRPKSEMDSKAVPREDDIKIVMAEEVREPGYEVMKADEIKEPMEPMASADEVITLDAEEELEILSGEENVPASNYVPMGAVAQLKRSSFQEEDYVTKKEIFNERRSGRNEGSVEGATRVRELFHMDVSELIIERERRSD